MPRMPWKTAAGLPKMTISFEGLAVKLTTPRVPNSSAWMTLTGLKLDISDAGTFSFWVNIPDVHRIESIALYVAADETFTRFFASSIEVRSEIAPGPQMIAISIKELQAYGGMTVQDVATTVQLRITSEMGDGSASFDHLYYGRRATPKIIVSFDDNWLSQFTEAFPYMMRKGVPGHDLRDSGNYRARPLHEPAKVEGGLCGGLGRWQPHDRP